jgi:hypothetical protein
MACLFDRYMNPIENLWAEVTRYLNNQEDQVSIVDELELHVALSATWAAIPVETLASLGNSMMQRTPALLAVRGGYTGAIPAIKELIKSFFVHGIHMKQIV